VLCCHVGRSGSTVLSDSLSQNPEVKSLSEFFTHYEQAGNDLRGITLDYVMALVSQQLKNCDEDVLFLEIKFMNFILNRNFGLLKVHKQLANYFDASTLLLRRKNTLKRIVSSEKAARSGVYHLEDSLSESAPYSEPFALRLGEGYDYDCQFYFTDLVHRLRTARKLEENIFAQMSLDARKVKSISYEENISSAKSLASSIAELSDWFGVSAASYTVKFKKTSGGLGADVSNFSEVGKALGGTEFAWMYK